MQNLLDIFVSVIFVDRIDILLLFLELKIKLLFFFLHDFDKLHETNK
jgi:hypothetical protein